MKRVFFVFFSLLTLASCATTQQNPAIRWINPDCPACNYQSDLAACHYDVSLRYTPQQASGGLLTQVVIAANNATEPQRLMDLCMAAKGWRAVPASETTKTQETVVQAPSPTEAQLESKESARTTDQRLEDCIQKANNNPVYSVLFKKMPQKGDPTLTQLSDNSLATDKEIKLIIAYYNDIKPCRDQLINDFMSMSPVMGSITAESFHTEDFIIVDLIQRRITWGEANKKMSVNLDECKAKLREVYEQQKP
jgi:hypothetical protein